MIDHRPQVVNDRSRFGGWEGDLIIGTRTRSAIGTLVDRKSGYAVLLHLPSRHTAAEVNASLITAISALPPEFRRTLTWDQGAEMASHDKIASLFTDGVFFAHAVKPWQRGSNENRNGMLRQCFPKHTDLAIHSVDDLAAVATKITNRPRKRLGWTTPSQLLADVLRST